MWHSTSLHQRKSDKARRLHDIYNRMTRVGMNFRWAPVGIHVNHWVLPHKFHGMLSVRFYRPHVSFYPRKVYPPYHKLRSQRVAQPRCAGW